MRVPALAQIQEFTGFLRAPIGEDLGLPWMVSHKHRDAVISLNAPAFSLDEGLYYGGRLVGESMRYTVASFIVRSSDLAPKMAKALERIIATAEFARVGDGKIGAGWLLDTVDEIFNDDPPEQRTNLPMIVKDSDASV
jgi:hypothetical protein